jgi:hypothetical protein
MRAGIYQVILDGTARRGEYVYGRGINKYMYVLLARDEKHLLFKCSALIILGIHLLKRLLSCLFLD